MFEAGILNFFKFYIVCSLAVNTSIFFFKSMRAVFSRIYDAAPNIKTIIRLYPCKMCGHLSAQRSVSIRW